MRIFNQLDHASLFCHMAVALGTFDGVHIGHQKVINRAIALAKQTGGASAVLTFKNHPLSVIAPERCPAQIMTVEQKVRVIESLGVDALFLVPFTKEILKMQPLEFIDVLVRGLTPSHVVVGPNYSFGFRGCGTPEMLKSAGQELGFVVEIQDAVYLDSTLVSSTVIRQLIAQGEVGRVAQLLGRPLRFSGKVVTGDQRGRALGFPTANFHVPDGQIAPDDGVYAVFAYVDGRRYQCLVNIGSNPTFPNQARRIEAHIFDFQGDLYGKEIAIDYLKKLRQEHKFARVEHLKNQIMSDIRAAQHYFLQMG